MTFRTFVPDPPDGEEIVTAADGGRFRVTPNGWVPLTPGDGPVRGRETIRASEILLNHPVDLAELLDDTERHVRRFIGFASRHQSKAVALWVAHVHVIDAAPMAAYLRVKSAAEECGKTTLLEVLHQLLGERGINATSVSPAVVYRLRDKVGPVALLLDESDKTMAKRQDDNAQDLVAIVNSGYRRSATVYRTEGRSFEPRAFKAFGPAAVAGIGHLEPTTESRCIPIVLARKPRGSLERFISFRVEPSAEEIRNRFRAWATPAVVAHLRDQTPAYPPELRDRHVEAWWNMVSIADLAGGEWPASARAAALALHVDADNEATLSTGVLLLAHTKAAFEESEVDRMPSADLVRALVANESGPWAKWWSAEASREGAPRAAATDLARKLRGFTRPDGEPIAPHVIKMPDGTTSRGYHAKDFEAAWSTYLPSLASPPVTDVTDATSLASTVTSVASVTTPHPKPTESTVDSRACSQCDLDGPDHLGLHDWQRVEVGP